MMRVSTNTIRSIIATAAGLLGCALAACSTAGAASPPITTQAAAANAAFLAYAPPPPGGARALCLVDTGVNPTPDTAPGLVSATAIDGGTGNDVDPLWHGTIDAAIAGGAGHGVLGAWPQLKLVSVRATDVPSPGQAPTYQFDDYVKGILKCSQPLPGVKIVAIAVPLSSMIPPTPDQSDSFTAAVNIAQAQGISILAAAGNTPGDVQLPASQPGIFAVGAGDFSGNACPFSATTGLTFFAPGCGLDQIDTAGEAFCCGNGTSQAAAFTAAVLVALRSYAPDLSPAAAVQFLTSTTRNGHLNVAAAFRAAGLGAVVDTGTAALPKPPAAALALAPAPTAIRRVPRPRVRSAIWRRGVLVLTLRSIPKGARLHAKITFPAREPQYLATSNLKLRARTPRPSRVVAYHTRAGGKSATVQVKVSRPGR